MAHQIALLTARRTLAAAAVAAALFAAAAGAGDRDVVVAIRVSAAGLDMRHAVDAQELYTRIRQAARVACTRGDRVGLEPADDPQECYEAAVGTAVRSANAPQLTAAYLGNHTHVQAAAHGIAVPAQLARK